MSKVVLGMTSFWPASLWIMTYTLKKLAELTKNAGYDGLEFFPFRNFAREIENGSEETKGVLRSGMVNSLHQSWRSETGIGGILRHPSPPLALSAFAMLRERRASLSTLVRIQHLASLTMPCVIFPYHTGFFGGQHWDEVQYSQFYSFPVRMVQPEKGLAFDRWKIPDFSYFPARAQEEGFTHICMDTKHIRGVIGTDVLNNLVKLKPMLSMIREVHFRGLFDDFHFIQALLKLGFSGDIVVEVPAGITKNAFLARHVPITSMLRHMLN